MSGCAFAGCYSSKHLQPTHSRVAFGSPAAAYGTGDRDNFARI
jgi:hypothetical protein